MTTYFLMIWLSPLTPVAVHEQEGGGDRLAALSEQAEILVLLDQHELRIYCKTEF